MNIKNDSDDEYEKYDIIYIRMKKKYEYKQNFITRTFFFHVSFLFKNASRFSFSLTMILIQNQ